MYGLYYLDNIQTFTELSEESYKCYCEEYDLEQREKLVSSLAWVKENPREDLTGVLPDLPHSNQEIHSYLNKFYDSLRKLGKSKNVKWVDTKVDADNRFSIGVEENSGQKYLSIPVSNRHVDYEEYYLLTESQYVEFLANADKAASFANECKGRKHDSLLIIKPGKDRGVAV